MGIVTVGGHHPLLSPGRGQLPIKDSYAEDAPRALVAPGLKQMRRIASPALHPGGQCWGRKGRGGGEWGAWSWLLWATSPRGTVRCRMGPAPRFASRAATPSRLVLQPWLRLPMISLSPRWYTTPGMSPGTSELPGSDLQPAISPFLRPPHLLSGLSPLDGEGQLPPPPPYPQAQAEHKGSATCCG